MGNTVVSIYYLKKSRQPKHINIQDFSIYFDEKELARYHRFTNKKAQNNFVLGRILTKSLLAQRLKCNASAINFTYSKTGKPSIANAENLYFSLSHCRSAIVVAIAECNIGVDAEETARAQKLQASSFLYISAEVANLIEAASDAGEAAEIFNLNWTGLESVVKLKDSTIFKERKNFVLYPGDVAQNPLRCSTGGISVLSFKPSFEFRISLAMMGELHECRFHECLGIEQSEIGIDEASDVS